MNIRFWKKKEDTPRAGNSYAPDEKKFEFPETVYVRLDPYTSSQSGKDCINGTDNLEDIRQYATSKDPVKVAIYVLAEVRTVEFPPTVRQTEVHRLIGASLPQPLQLNGPSEQRIVGPEKKTCCP